MGKGRGAALEMSAALLYMNSCALQLQRALTGLLKYITYYFSLMSHCLSHRDEWMQWHLMEGENKGTAMRWRWHPAPSAYISVFWFFLFSEQLGRQLFIQLDIQFYLIYDMFLWTLCGPCSSNFLCDRKGQSATEPSFPIVNINITSLAEGGRCSGLSSGLC